MLEGRTSQKCPFVDQNLFFPAMQHAFFICAHWTRYFYLAAGSRQTKSNIIKSLQTGLFMVLVKWATASKRTNDTRALLPK